MKIKYEFANETVEIEVEENWGAVLVELDRQEYNNDHAETRRHISLESSVEEGGNAWLPSDADVEHDVLQKAEFERLYAAMQMLEPRQKKLIYQVFFEGKKHAEIAEEEGVERTAVTHAVQRAVKKIKKFFI